MSNMLQVYGTISQIMGNNNYKVEVEIEGNKREILCHLAGKMRQFKINVIAGDEVTVEIPPPYDKGRITFRGRKSDEPGARRRKGR